MGSGGMTTFEIWMLVVTAAGLLLTAAAAVVAVTRGVEKIKQDTSEKIADEVMARTAALATETGNRNTAMENLRREFEDAQKAQDRNTGEMGSALRRFIETVEKEMHAIEIWGRDHYVQKPDFEKAIDAVLNNIREMRADIKADIQNLDAKIKPQPNH